MPALPRHRAVGWHAPLRSAIIQWMLQIIGALTLLLGALAVGQDQAPRRDKRVLFKELKHGDAYTRDGAADELKGHPGLTQDDIPALSEALKRERSYRGRWKVILIFGSMGDKSRSAFPLLSEIVRNDRDPQLRIEVLQALSAIEGPSSRFREILRETLRSGHRSGLEAIRLARPHGMLRDLSAELRGLLASKPWELRAEAARTLGDPNLGTQEAVPALASALSDPSGMVRYSAAESLSKLGAAGFDELLEARASSSPVAQRAAVYRLGESGPASAGARDGLLSLLGSRDPKLRSSAAEALGKTGIKEPRWESELIRLLNSDPDPGVRREAAEALGRIGTSSATFQALSEAKGDQPMVARFVEIAIWRLSGGGPKAGAPRHNLERIQRDDYEKLAALHDELQEQFVENRRLLGYDRAKLELVARLDRGVEVSSFSVQRTETREYVELFAFGQNRQLILDSAGPSYWNKLLLFNRDVYSKYLAEKCKLQGRPWKAVARVLDAEPQVEEYSFDKNKEDVHVTWRGWPYSFQHTINLYSKAGVLCGL